MVKEQVNEPGGMKFRPLANISDVISRPRLMDLLRLAPPVTARLTVVTAPAGFGKSTVLAQLAASLRANGERTAWLNCDALDRQPDRFLESLAEALHQAGVLANQDPGNGIAALMRQVETGASAVTLFIDEYEQAANSAVDELVATLAHLLPPAVHVVIGTREKPRIPLTQLQLRGLLRLIDAAALRFDEGETARLLDGLMSAASLPVISARAEGWPFVLQLMRLRAAAGGDWLADAQGPLPRADIFDYLASEIMETLPPPVQDFLTTVSILSDIDVAAANAIRATPDSYDFMRHLAALTPIIVIGESPPMIRLHPLLRDYLQTRLRQQGEDRFRALHIKAAQYYAARHEIYEAARHAAAADRPDLVARIIEDAGAMRMAFDAGPAVMRALLELLPEDLILARPRLRLMRIGLMAVEENAIEAALAFARLVEMVEAGAYDSTIDDIARLEIELLRCVMLVTESEHQLEWPQPTLFATVMDMARARYEEDPRILGIPLATEVMFLHRYGPIDKAGRRTAELIRLYSHEGYRGSMPWAWIYAALEAYARADLDSAEQALLRVLAHDIDTFGDHQSTFGQLANALLARLYYMKDMIGTAQAHIEAIEPSRPFMLLEILECSMIYPARAAIAQGQADDALALLVTADAIAEEKDLPHLALATLAMRIEVLLLSGRLDEAETVARKGQLDRFWAVASKPFALPWSEVEALGRARILLSLARKDKSAAREQGQTFLSLARLNGRAMGEALALLLVARVDIAHGDKRAAQQSLAAALALTERSGALRLFLDMGPEISALLRTDPSSDWARAILAAWDESAQQRSETATLLTPRETDVLMGVAQDYSTKEIARHLALSPDTVKYHLKSIFSKLGVHSRDDAVTEARRRALLQ